MTNNKVFKLYDITRYEDVEEGTLLLAIGDRVKTWKAIWLSNLRIDRHNTRSLPDGDYAVRYDNYHQWVDCPRISLRLRTFMWIEPLNASCWQDMGVNLYLCAATGWPNPLPPKEFSQLSGVLYYNRVDLLTVEPPVAINGYSRFSKEEQSGIAGFWADV